MKILSGRSTEGPPRRLTINNRTYRPVGLVTPGVKADDELDVTDLAPTLGRNLAQGESSEMHKNNSRSKTLWRLAVAATCAASLGFAAIPYASAAEPEAATVITPKIDSRPVTSTGEVFFDKVFKFNTPDGKGLIAGNSEGTETVGVDDEIIVEATRPDATVKTLVRNYEFQPPGAPIDLSEILLPGTNSLRIKLRDTFGAYLGSEPLWLVHPGTPNNPNPFPRYVAMGDSYASGEGAPPFEAGTDGTNGNWCHRSVNAAAAQFASDPGPDKRRMELVHVACSGAKVKDLAGYQGNSGPQYAALTPGTKLVTISIGGNDVGFAPILRNCIVRICLDLDRYRVGDRIKALGPKLDEVFTTIKSKSPQARIMIVGYPHLANESFFCNSSLRWNERRWINDTGARGKAAIVAAARRNGATYVDIVKAFSKHGICDRDPWINDLVAPAFNQGGNIQPKQ